jgi:hypothetical protein
MIDVHSGLIHYLIDERWWAIPMWNPRYFSGALLEMIGARFLRRDHFAGNERWTEKRRGMPKNVDTFIGKEMTNHWVLWYTVFKQTQGEVWWLVLASFVRNSGSCWNVRPAHFCTWEEKLADVAARLRWNAKLAGAYIVGNEGMGWLLVVIVDHSPIPY